MKTNYSINARWLQGAASTDGSEKMQVNPRKSLSKEGLTRDESSTRLRVDYVSFTSRLRVWKRVACVIAVLFALGVGNVCGGVHKWDLSTSSYSAATGLLVTWSSTGATMTLAKGSGNAPNSYLGNGLDQLHTRFYKSNVLTITPASGYSVSKIIITCTSTDYDDGFESTWTNASKSNSDGVITVTPTTATSACSVTLGSSTNPNRVTQVVVYYSNDAEIVVTDPNYNGLDDDHGYDFGTVETTSGSVTLHVEGFCIYKAYPESYDYYIELYPYGDDASNFRVNGVSDAYINSLSTNITLSYTGLSTNKTYETTLKGWAYKASSCWDHKDDVIWINIPISVTFDGSPSATASPISWDFGNVGVGETVTKDFTITTGNLTGNLSVAMFDGSVGMSVSPTSIAKAATSTTVTVTFIPASSGLKEDLVTISGGGLDDDLDIEVSGTGVVLHAVHWVVNGVDWSLSPSSHGNPTTQVADGTKPLKMPTTPVAGDDGCGDKFMGWTTSEISGSLGSAPTPCWNSLTYFQNVTAEIWYYAVFADEKP